ncbi:MAG: hypothetical protein QME16_01785 [Planctomycetota bacterium]|nr:hypothetical protein [Planctomycetota bacterium]
MKSACLCPPACPDGHRDGRQIRADRSGFVECGRPDINPAPHLSFGWVRGAAQLRWASLPPTRARFPPRRARLA